MAKSDRAINKNSLTNASSISYMRNTPDSIIGMSRRRSNKTSLQQQNTELSKVDDTRQRNA